MPVLNITEFENEVAVLCNNILALEASINRQSALRWSSATGAGYEGVWNDGILGPNDTPVGARLTQSQANNMISAINSIKGAIDTASSPVSFVSELAP